MTLPRLRLDASFVFCVTLSVVLHSLLLAAIWGEGSSQQPHIVSAINVHLAAVRPVATSTSVPVAPPESKSPAPDEPTLPVAETPKQPTTSSTTLATEEPPVISSVPSVPTTASVSLNVDSLRTFIDSNAKPSLPTLEGSDDIAAQYRNLWHQRVQRIGQLNYPAAATKLKRTGQLVLRVAINPDGTLANVGIVRSSGYDELDLAALDIVRQSQPYDPLPLQLPRDNGQFRFLSNWEFRR